MKRYSPMVAIDVATQDEALALFARLAVEPRPILKIGMELYYHFGPAIIKEAQQRGFKIFLDLKLHDIPNTVKRALFVLGQLGVDFTTIHAAGGSAMVAAGADGLRAGAAAAGLPAPKLLAITELTSIDEQTLHAEQHVDLSLVEAVQNYARLAEWAGAAGVVCSAQEVQAVRQVTGPDFLCVTPGIRPRGFAKGDQKRVVTPHQARQLGSNAIVVGRPITQAPDAVAAYQAINQEFLREED